MKTWQWQLHGQVEIKNPAGYIIQVIEPHDIILWHNEDGSFGGMQYVPSSTQKE